MDNGKRKVVMAQMKPRERHEWTAKTPHRRRFKWDMPRKGIRATTEEIMGAW